MSLKLKLFIQNRQIAMQKYTSPVIETEKIWMSRMSVQSMRQSGSGVKALIFDLKSWSVLVELGWKAAKIEKGIMTIGRKTSSSDPISKNCSSASLISEEQSLKQKMHLVMRKAMLRPEKHDQSTLSVWQLVTMRSFAGTRIQGALSRQQGFAMVRMTDTRRKRSEMLEQMDCVSTAQVIMRVHRTN